MDIEGDLVQCWIKCEDYWIERWNVIGTRCVVYGVKHDRKPTLRQVANNTGFFGTPVFEKPEGIIK